MVCGQRYEETPRRAAGAKNDVPFRALKAKVESVVDFISGKKNLHTQLKKKEGSSKHDADGELGKGPRLDNSSKKGKTKNAERSKNDGTEKTVQAHIATGPAPS